MAPPAAAFQQIPPALAPIRANWSALRQAIENGDLSQAQRALAALHADPQGAPERPQLGRISAQFNALANALAARDLAGARTAFTALQAVFLALRETDLGPAAGGVDNAPDMGFPERPEDDAAVTAGSEKL